MKWTDRVRCAYFTPGLRGRLFPTLHAAFYFAPFPRIELPRRRRQQSHKQTLTHVGKWRWQRAKHPHTRTQGLILLIVICSHYALGLYVVYMIGIFRSKTLAGNESFICGLNASGPNFVPTPITSHSNRALYASEAYICICFDIRIYKLDCGRERALLFYIYMQHVWGEWGFNYISKHYEKLRWNLQSQQACLRGCV